MLQIPNYSGRHPELTTPNRRVGRIYLSRTILPSWLDSRIPCWAGRHHAFGPLFTDPDTRRVGRDCYRCGKWFPAQAPETRILQVRRVEPQRESALHRLAHPFGGHHGRLHFR